MIRVIAVVCLLAVAGACGSGSSGDDSAEPAGNLCTYPESQTWSADGNHSHTVSGTAANQGESARGKNRPAFQEVLFCRKL